MTFPDRHIEQGNERLLEWIEDLFINYMQHDMASVMLCECNDKSDERYGFPALTFVGDSLKATLRVVVWERDAPDEPRFVANIVEQEVWLIDGGLDDPRCRYRVPEYLMAWVKVAGEALVTQVKAGKLVFPSDLTQSRLTHPVQLQHGGKTDVSVEAFEKCLRVYGRLGRFLK